MVTWNNPPTREWDDLVAMLNPAYMVGQLERGENGTLHWQFAIQWSHSRSFAAIKKDLPLAHFEEVRSWAAAVQYCQKEDSRDSGPWEYGKPAYRRVRQGSGRGLGHVVYSPRRGALRRFPPKFKLSTWATWNASTARTSSSSTKRMCVECGFGVSPVSVRATLPARCSELRGTTLSSTISGGWLPEPEGRHHGGRRQGNDQVSAPPPKDLVRPLGLHRRDERRSGCP